MQRNEFQEDRHIDVNALDVEVAKQPELFFKWSERAVNAKAKVDSAKLRMDVVEATLLASARQHPDDFGIAGRVTDSSVKAAVAIHPDYIKAVKEWHDAREEAGMLSAAVQTMEQKKRMLESLITLHGQNYFAGPSTPRDLGAAWAAQQERSATRLNVRQTTKARKRKRKVRKG